MGSPHTLPTALPRSGLIHTLLLPLLSPMALSSAHSSLIFTSYPCLTSSLTTPTYPSILTPTTFNYILTAQTSLIMPLTDSPPV